MSSSLAEEALLGRGTDIQVVSTYAEIMSRIVAARALLTSQGIPLHRDSALSMLFREAESASKAFHEGVAGQNVANEVLRIAHAHRVASAIVAVGLDPGAQECLRRMTSGAMNLAERATSRGKDALWEIELAAKLRSRGFGLQMTEPDLVLDMDGVPFPIACKRVYSEKSVEVQMRKGVQQIERTRRAGLVAFSIDELTPENSILVSPDAISAGDHIARLNRAFIDRHAAKLARFIASGRCDAVLVNTSVVADLQSSSPRINEFSQFTIWRLTNPPPSRAFEAIRKRLIEG